MNELMQFFQSTFGVLVTGIGVFTSVNALFFKADDYFSESFRNDVSSWLLNITPKEDNSWSVCFSKLFDVVFIKNKTYVSHSHFKFSNYMTWYCFFRSCITSTVSVVILIMVGITLGLMHSEDFNFEIIIIIAFLLVSMNFIPDYISLIQTRYFISVLEKKESISRVIIICFLDLILTMAIFFVFGVIMSILNMLLLSVVSEKLNVGFIIADIAASFLDYVFSDLIGVITNFDRMLLLDLYHDSGAGYFGPFVYSTLFTSVWIWMFAISNFLIKSINYTFSAVDLIKYALPINEKPFRSIGIVASLISMVLYWIAFII